MKFFSRYSKRLLLCFLVSLSTPALGDSKVSIGKLSKDQRLFYDLTFGNSNFLFSCVDKMAPQQFGKLKKIQVVSYEDDQYGYYLLVNAKRTDWAGFSKYLRYEVGIYKIRHNRIECGFRDYLGKTSRF